jgi:hypothetical protein
MLLGHISSLRRKLLLAAILLAAAALMLPPRAAQADIGPKPTAHFEFIQLEEQGLAITGGILYQCSQPDCADAAPLEEVGPQGFACQSTSCSATAYGFRDYLFLEITFSDGSTRRSHIFPEGRAHQSSFGVEVDGEHLAVREQRMKGLLADAITLSVVYAVLGLMLLLVSPAILIPLAALGLLFWLRRRSRQGGAFLIDSQPVFVSAWVFALPAAFLAGFTPALPLTILIEGGLAWGYSRWKRLPELAVITAAALLNLITLPLLWKAVAAAPAGGWGLLLVGEIAVWLVEAAGFKLVFGTQLSLRQALLLSGIVNLASFAIGLALPV